MTFDEKPFFVQAFARLTKSGVIRDVDTLTMEAYFEALSDLPLWAIERAELHLRRHPVKFFQGSPTWHDTAERILLEQRKRDAIRLAGRRLQPVHCLTCQDTAMRIANPGGDVERLTRCECADSNPNYLAVRARAVLSDDSETPTIPAGESQRILGTVRDFKRIASGE